MDSWVSQSYSLIILSTEKWNCAQWTAGMSKWNMCANVVQVLCRKNHFKDPLNADVCHYSQQHSCLAACGTQKDQQAVATNNVAKKSVNLWKRTQNLKMPPLEQERDWQKVCASLCMFNNTFCDVSHRLGKRCREKFTSCNSRLDTEGLGPRDQKQRPPQDALDHRRDHRPLRHLMVTWHMIITASLKFGVFFCFIVLS